jgi:hypothetical protein
VLRRPPLNELPPMHARGSWKPPIIVNINEITISPRNKGNEFLCRHRTR